MSTTFLQHIIGSSQRGYANGTFSQAKFYFPQGVVFKDENVLIIADTGNHAIRQVLKLRKSVQNFVNNLKFSYTG